MTTRSHRRRIRGGVGLLILVAGIGAGTFFVGRWTAPLRTNSQSGAAPAPDVLVTVTRRQLTLSVDLTATVHPAAETSVPLLPPADVARSVVTATPQRAGNTVQSGTVLIAVSGRPLIALPGSEPAYRNLSTGDSGPDVRQLQQALRTLGYRPDTDGAFGAHTGAAVAALYADRGYPAIRPSATTISVPAGELAFVPHLPARLAALPVAVGTDPTGKALTIDSAAAGAVVAQLSTAASASAPPRTPVLLQCAGRQVHGLLGAEVIDRSAPASSDPGAAPTSDLATRAVSLSEPLAGTPVGTICPGTATVAITPAPVLAAPASAVYDTNDRGTVVHVRADNATSTVPVTIGRSGGGWLELTNPPAAITAGAILVVGSGGP